MANNTNTYIDNNALNLTATDITGGTFNIAQIPTGTTSTTVSRGDHTHSYLPLSGGTVNGLIVLGKHPGSSNYGGELYFNSDGNALEPPPHIICDKRSSLEICGEWINFKTNQEDFVTINNVSIATAADIYNLKKELEDLKKTVSELVNKIK